MGLPQQPVTLSPAQIEELNTKLHDMRHNINNNLSLIVAAAELARRKPDAALRMIETMEKQPEKVTVELRTFSAFFEQAYGITRDE